MLIAATDKPAPAERMAAFETRLLPGSESKTDWAFFFGSSVGTLEAERIDVTWVEMDGSVRMGRVGRRREAPTALLARREAMSGDESGEVRDVCSVH